MGQLEKQIESRKFLTMDERNLSFDRKRQIGHCGVKEGRSLNIMQSNSGDYLCGVKMH
jgi:hypothetical protein